MADPDPSTRLSRAGWLLLRLGLLGVLVALAWAALDRLEALAQGMEGGGALGLTLLLGLLLLYAGLIALPFVPGIELGLTLMMLRGGEVAPGVYLATLAGLLVAYAFGASVREERLARGLAGLGLARASGLVARLDGLAPPRRLALLRARIPGRIGRALVRRRYLLLAVLINLPGNAVIGGGGGICLSAGASRLFRARLVAPTLALAILPVPLAVWLFDMPLLPAVA